MFRSKFVRSFFWGVLLLGACSSSTPPAAPAARTEAMAGASAAPGLAGFGTDAAGGNTSGGKNDSVTAGAPAAGSSSGGAFSSAGGSTNAAGSGATAGSAGAGAGVTSLPLDHSACTPGSGRMIYVAPDGSAQGNGSSFASAYDLPSATSLAAPGDTLLLRAGKYVIPYVAGAKNSLTLSQKGAEKQPIRIIASGGRAELDFSFPEQAWVQDSVGLLVSGDYWSLCRVDITRAGYQGAYVTGQHNTFEDCSFHDNRNTGLEINKGGAYTTVINCDSYRNYDPKKSGSMADGFGPKETQGPGNRFYGCRAWENSDDGYDAYNSPETVVFERCWAFRNGVDVWQYGGFSGNGNGFKIGGLAQQANHRLTQCAAFDNPVKGFDQNNNTGGLTLYNCTSVNNGTNFGLGGNVNAGQRHDLRNNVALGAAGNVANANEQNNAWNLKLAVTSADFKDLDVAHGSAPRAADGSLPPSDFLQLAPSSALIDKGVDVGLPFAGSAPDLGAFEAR